LAKLTKRKIDALKPDSARRQFAWDSELPGFGLVLHPSGRRVYVLQYRSASGRSRRIALGTHGELTPEQARKIAADRLLEARSGRDPAAERWQARDALSVRELAERYLDIHCAKKKPRSVAEDRRILARYILPAIGSHAAIDVGVADVSKLHAAMRATPFQANRVLAVLSTLFGLAERWGIRPRGTNPCSDVERYREAQRQRFLSDAELARLGEGLAELEREGPEGAQWASIFRLLLFTGARRGVVVDLRWDEVDFDGGCLRLADSKTGAKTIPLGAPALALLAALPRKDKRVFPRRPGITLGNQIRGPWARTLERSGIDGLRVHDLRHTDASIGAGAGLSLYAIGNLLGHRKASTTQRYAHLTDDPLKAAADRVSGRIAAALDGKPGADVVPLRP
jgi:integrase